MNKQFSGSVITQVDQIIQMAIEEGASDIHLEPFEKKYRLRFRIDGVLQHIASLQPSQKDAITSRIKIMAELDIAEKRRPQDGRIKIRTKKGQDIDLRVSSLPTQYGEKMVLRILDKGSQELNLEALGLTDKMLADFRKEIHNPYGMILVTGPTGSGKTTTLYSALNELNSPDVNITTIEDPIEYNLDGINQTQVHEEIGLSFAHILRSILRQDPNIIMVGEIRDKETAEIAIRSALTGHLVFSTLHTNDAASAVSRMVEMGVEPFLVASSVRLVLAQRLVRKICPSCKEICKPDSHLVEELGIDGNTAFYRGKGCEKCNESGYKGRTALLELMVLNNKLSESLIKNPNAGQLKAEAITFGMNTLREAGIQKIMQGETTIEEVYRETTL
ncbi:MAG: GspE/PulE family protein [Balneolaceae bacterium]